MKVHIISKIFHILNKYVVLESMNYLYCQVTSKQARSTFFLSMSHEKLTSCQQG